MHLKGVSISPSARTDYASMVVMNLYFEFVLITSYMVITYHMIALKYRKSTGFSSFTPVLKVSWVSLHVFIVSTNIFFYFWFISKDFNPVHLLLRASGLLLFAAGLLFIFWGAYTLRKAVFVPENKLVIAGPYRFTRHPMYSGGIIGAFGLAVFAGSVLGAVYSFALALVLSHIADAEEEELRARFGKAYLDYKKSVPKLFPNVGIK
ncbi:MAG: isoprenylcysteine carboxylmethyltransferase family protein [Candidatus Methanoperedens sp.]|nr:isoprenylcysteine carboxylmethyltransferase family protein [Candidatus Methanoperedens sp.]MCZ7405379.1 isoprenylcysteine carboxylmethyltransferase family protein [Candidatus Methanoperedens sp.]